MDRIPVEQLEKIAQAKVDSMKKATEALEDTVRLGERKVQEEKDLAAELATLMCCISKYAGQIVPDPDRNLFFGRKWLGKSDRDIGIYLNQDGTWLQEVVFETNLCKITLLDPKAKHPSLISKDPEAIAASFVEGMQKIIEHNELESALKKKEQATGKLENVQKQRNALRQAIKEAYKKIVASEKASVTKKE